MQMKFGFIALAAVLTLVGCAPATQPQQQRPSTQAQETARAEAARARFTVKVGEIWQMTAFKPGNQESQKFPLDLYGEPEISRGYLVAEAEAGRYDAALIYDPSDDSLFVGIRLSNDDDADIVYCTFDKAATGQARYDGKSLFGKVSDLDDDNLPDARFAKCSLELKK
jgi:hypothetical protein